MNFSEYIILLLMYSVTANVLPVSVISLFNYFVI